MNKKDPRELSPAVENGPVELPESTVLENFAMPLPGEFAVRNGNGNLIFLAPPVRRNICVH